MKTQIPHGCLTGFTTWLVIGTLVAVTSFTASGCVLFLGGCEDRPEVQLESGTFALGEDEEPFVLAGANPPWEGAEDLRMEVDAEDARLQIRYVRDGVEVTEHWDVVRTR
jgi:hypothetical protein